MSAEDRWHEWSLRRSGYRASLLLGVPLNMWRPIPDHPVNEWIRARLSAEGKDAGDSEVAFFASRTLLDDVVHAAFAIAHTVDKIGHTAFEIQASATEHEPTADTADVPMGLVTPAVLSVYIEYANLLTWIRTLQDRMRSNEPRAGKRGLIPALQPGSQIKRQVETVYDVFDRAFDDEKYLANYSLHMRALPGGGTPLARIDRSGDVRLAIPDRASAPVYLFDQHTYEQRRDLLTFAHDVLAAVDRFMDDLLAAFENEAKAFAAAARAHPKPT